MHAGEIRNRADLYRGFLGYLEVREEDAKVLRSRNLAAVVDDLREVAFATLKSGYLGQFPRTIGRQILGADRLEDLLRGEYVLRLLETGEEPAFRHRSFQEYLAATVLRERWQTTGLDAVQSVLEEPVWQESIMFLAGMLTPYEHVKLMDELLARYARASDSVRHGLLRTMCLCLREGVLALPKHQHQVLRHITDLMKAEPSTAFELLAAWGKGLAEDALISMVSDRRGDFDGRLRATTVLARSRSRRAVDALMSVLASDDNVSVKNVAAEALRAGASHNVLDTLTAGLADPHLDARLAAVRAIAQVGGELSAKRLVGMLSDSSDLVRWEAAVALNGSMAIFAVDALVAVLSDDVDYVRWTAAEALGQTRDERAVMPLVACVADTVDRVRWRAVVALARIGSERALPPLAELLFWIQLATRAYVLVRLMQWGNFDTRLRMSTWSVRWPTPPNLCEVGRPLRLPMFGWWNHCPNSAPPCRSVSQGNCGGTSSVPSGNSLTPTRRPLPRGTLLT